ncbi:hypothetical protein [Pseudoalteromonas sp. R3]|uniref:hypothetical protein n=1 Tax=Pseudoalteromonas sp. R3 TaxID=1709477 RepID=UPI0006B5BCEE|nr:hypothetical protein [Pseudoalteromonas sp. R3]AZZ98748.1 hypothetical protein ELR70_17580 [Pseudoalteromonas sp. R3]
MTIPVTVYRSDDAGAPQVTDGTPAEWFAVLKQCLVDGYGAKSPAGWKLIAEVEDPPHMTLQNNVASGGSGGYAMFSSPQIKATAIMVGQTALDYSSVADHDRVGRTFRWGLYWSAATADKALKNWMIIASATGFYMFVYANEMTAKNCINSEVHGFFYVGDYVSTTPNDPARFISASGDQRTGSINYTESLGEIHLGTKAVGVAYPLDSSTTTQELYTQTIFGTRQTPSGNYDAKPDVTVLCPIYLFSDTTSVSSASLNDPITPWCRGHLPGIFSSAQCGYGSEQMPYFKHIDGQSYWSVPYTRSSSSGSAIWINTVEWQHASS